MLTAAARTTAEKIKKRSLTAHKNTKQKQRKVIRQKKR